MDALSDVLRVVLKVDPRFIFMHTLWNGGVSSAMSVMLTLSHGVSWAQTKKGASS